MKRMRQCLLASIFLLLTAQVQARPVQVAGRWVDDSTPRPPPPMTAVPTASYTAPNATSGIHVVNDEILMVSEQAAILYVINANNGALKRQVNLPSKSDSDPGGFGIVAVNGYWWHVDYQRKRLYKLNPSDGSVVTSFSTSQQYLGITWDGTNLWGIDVSKNLYRINIETGGILNTYTLNITGTPIDITWDGANLWAVDSSNSNVYRLSTTGQVLETKTGTTGWQTGIAAQGSLLWIAETTARRLFTINGCAAPVTLYPDADGDSWGTSTGSISACGAMSGYATRAGDCNDASSSINPGATEVCDAKDNDCDGATDEGVTSTFYTDSDRDGYGNAASPVQACSAATGTSSNALDCDDTKAGVNPAALEVAYDGLDNDCKDGDLTDVDEDGYDAAEVDGPDCDDEDPTVNPGEAEIPYDGIDNDCEDGDADDLDHDGVVGSEAGGPDCDDSRDDVYPGALEICLDGIDQDCDGVADEGFDQDGDGHLSRATCALGTDCDDTKADVHPGAAEVCADGIDQDCDGSKDEGFDQDGDGYLSQATCASGNDCDDTKSGINPGAAEVCDGVDQNCDGATDEGFEDLDEDGLADCVDGDQDGDGAAAGEDCDDRDAEVHPGAEEVCDGVDQDCDGQIDEGYDLDGDLHFSAEDCAEVGGDDCNDQAASIYTGAEEVCDDLDNDCDNTIDEGFEDLDQDGHADCIDDDKDGDGAAAAEDCDDRDADIHPGASETCDGIDQNCDGMADDGFDQDGDDHLSAEACADIGGDDCNDTDSSIHPGAEDVCDGVDRDCDGADESDCGDDDDDTSGDDDDTSGDDDDTSGDDDDTSGDDDDDATGDDDDATGDDDDATGDDDDDATGDDDDDATGDDDDDATGDDDDDDATGDDDDDDATGDDDDDDATGDDDDDATGDDDDDDTPGGDDDDDDTTGDDGSSGGCDCSQAPGRSGGLEGLLLPLLMALPLLRRARR